MGTLVKGMTVMRLRPGRRDSDVLLPHRAEEAGSPAAGQRKEDGAESTACGEGEDAAAQASAGAMSAKLQVEGRARKGSFPPATVHVRRLLSEAAAAVKGRGFLQR